MWVCSRLFAGSTAGCGGAIGIAGGADIVEGAAASTGAGWAPGDALKKPSGVP